MKIININNITAEEVLVEYIAKQDNIMANFILSRYGWYIGRCETIYGFLKEIEETCKERLINLFTEMLKLS